MLRFLSTSVMGRGYSIREAKREADQGAVAAAAGGAGVSSSSGLTIPACFRSGSQKDCKSGPIEFVSG